MLLHVSSFMSGLCRRGLRPGRVVGSVVGTGGCVVDGCVGGESGSGFGGVIGCVVDWSIITFLPNQVCWSSLCIVHLYPDFLESFLDCCLLRFRRCLRFPCRLIVLVVLRKEAVFLWGGRSLPYDLISESFSLVIRNRRSGQSWNWLS